MDRLPTGIDSIDRRLDGGFKTGSLVVLTAPPDTQSHSVFHQVMQERPTVYITALRSAADIEGDLGYLSDRDVTVSIEEVGETVGKDGELLHELAGSSIYSANTTERSQVMDEVYEVVRKVEGSRNVIIDPAAPLERSESRSAYQNLLTEVKATLRETESLGMLYCPTTENPPPLREMTMTVADAVWELEVTPGRRDELELRTRIPKNRGADPILEELTLLVKGADVYTDDTRNI